MAKGIRLVTALLLALVLLLTPLAVTADTALTRYANYTTGDDSSVEAYGVHWFAQTFNTTESYVVEALHLKLYGEGTAGVLTASVRETSAGLPSGLDLCSGTIDGATLTTSTDGEWYEIDIDAYTLEENTTYAIVARGTGINATNNVHWRFDSSSPTYAGGSECSSLNAGVSWAADAGSDLMFEVYGNPSMEIYGANVFSGFLASGDWIITVEYLNVYEPYRTEQDSKSSFLLQLLKADDTLIAQVPLTAWGYKPGSIYLSAASVASLEWGSAYKMRLYGTQGTHATTDYTLTTTDWRGSDLTRLDDWCLRAAYNMETYYDVDLVVPTATQGDVLNVEGSIMFITGIPYLDQARPGIFQYVGNSPVWETQDWTHAYEGSLPGWEASVGPEIASVLTGFGDSTNLSGKNFGALIIFAIFIGMALIGVAKGHAVIGLALATPILIGGSYLGFIPFAIMGIVLTFAVIFMVRQLWWRST